MTFLHLSAPDLAGHAHGWGSSEYADAVRTVDGWLADVLGTVEGKPVLRKHLTILLTADHGGTGTNHVDPTLPEDYTIPFLAWGDGVAEGADLYDLNDDYRDPQDGRPGYAMKRQPDGRSTGDGRSPMLPTRVSSRLRPIRGTASSSTRE